RIRQQETGVEIPHGIKNCIFVVMAWNIAPATRIPSPRRVNETEQRKTYYKASQNLIDRRDRRK
ncbi:hypothetical protein, partial [Escherichia coli]|uniref:hypothetical protein n=1 Tax=Escherichia coli TaxID=562 RepID=UPI001BE472BF